MDRNKSNMVSKCLDKYYFAIEHRTGSTHPGAKHSPMCSRLMLSVMPGMFRRLCLGYSTDSEDTEHDEN